MATLIPSSIAGRSISSAEQKVLERLDDTLDDAWRVYHGLRYIRPPSSGQPAVEGEIDILILHPDHGMLVLEVKGGGISYDGRDGRFTSEDRQRKKNEIKNPFAQAASNLHELKELIGAKPGWSETGIDFVHGHGVIFPDCTWAPAVAASDMWPEIVIDCVGMTTGNPADRLLAMFEFWGKYRKSQVPLGKQRLKRLGQQVLAPRFALTPAVGDIMAWDEKALVRLSDEQELVLDFLERNPRAVVEGCAGSGKTLIALERARRLAAEGKSVLLLCFNRILGQTLKEAVRQMEGLPGRVTASTFHSLCRNMWEKSDREWTGEPGRTERSEEASRFWREETASRLSISIAELPDRFDALVVDEAQDFETMWWTPLHVLLSAPDAPVSLLLDPDQDLWERNTKLGEGLAVFPLRSNRRSTRAIAEFAAQIAKVRVRNPWGVPDGEWPQVARWKDDDEQLSLVAGKVRWLLEDQGVDLSRIAIVGMHAWERSFLCRAGKAWEVPVQEVDDLGNTELSGALRYATPQRFKGLEADVVLLVDVDGNLPGCRPRNLYVAASRARHRLYVFAKNGVELPEAPG